VGSVKGTTAAVSETVKGTTAAVAETVENVKDTLETTVENVKDTIQTTIDSVKDTFDLRLQTQRHPWVMVGGSVFAGYVIGSMLPSTRRIASTMTPDAASASPVNDWSGREDRSASRMGFAGSSSGSTSRRSSLLSGVMEQFGPEIQKLKGVAIGAIGALVRDMIKEKIPQGLRPHVQDMIHDVTQKLGGEDINGPVMPTSEQREPSFAR